MFSDYNRIKLEINKRKISGYLENLEILETKHTSKQPSVLRINHMGN